MAGVTRTFRESTKVAKPTSAAGFWWKDIKGRAKGIATAPRRLPARELAERATGMLGAGILKPVTSLQTFKLGRALSDIRKSLTTGRPLPSVEGVSLKRFAKRPDYSWNIIHFEPSWGAHEPGVLKRAAKYVLENEYPSPETTTVEHIQRLRKLASNILGVRPLRIIPKGPARPGR
jgi:hypothetical protein